LLKSTLSKLIPTSKQKFTRKERAEKKLIRQLAGLNRQANLLLVIIGNFIPARLIEVKGIVLQFLSIVTTLISERGLEFAILYVKESRNIIMKFITNTPLTVGKLVEIKDGWPVKFNFLKPLIENRSPENLKILHSILIITRGLKTKAHLNLEPITQE
jgi:hypothetical protein